MNTVEASTYSEDEANLHAVRSVLYRSVWRLLDPSGGGTDVAALRAELGALHCPVWLLPARDELSTALKGVDKEKLLAAQRRLSSASTPADAFCTRGYGSAWPRACVLAEIQASINPLAEVYVLARLATNTEAAVREGNESLARELRTLQRQLLSQHSGLCLETLGARLAATGGPLYSGVGRALERLIEADVVRIDSH